MLKINNPGKVVAYYFAIAFAFFIISGCQEDNNSVNNNDKTKELQLRQDMRKLWTDHVVWTRDYIIAAVDGASDAQAAATRLLKNQEDIGNAIVPYYGRAVGDSLTVLLKEHIMIAVDLVDAAKNNNQTELDESNTRWSQNGQNIADFLSSANPYWPKDTLRNMMNMHLQKTIEETVARITKDYDRDVMIFDEVYNHILSMADVLSDGIIRQFPDKF